MRKHLYFLFLFTLPFLGYTKEYNQVLYFPKAEVLNNSTTRIPFKLVDHLIVIEAKLLDQTGNFIIDTGSESLILNKNHFKGKMTSSQPNKQNSGVIDFIDNPLEKQLHEFIIKDLVIKNKFSDVIDLSSIEISKKMHLLGIIGYDLLKDYEIFIDMHLNQITLSQVNSKGEKFDKSVYLEKIIDSVDIKKKKHTIVLEASVNNQNLKFGLDSAAEYNQLNKKVNKEALKQFFPKRKLQLVGVSGKKIEVLAGKLYRVKLTDAIYFGPMQTILTNLNKMNIAFGTQLDGVLGYEFLRQQRTIINYKKEKLYFVKQPLYKE
ncbi:hypothetical protein [Psychroserpens sp.]|uniref:hypothetical protein n=1 Tax=Psychroserpens sp. TaxID=2020870 RepID=UPI00385BA638